MATVFWTSWVRRAIRSRIVRPGGQITVGDGHNTPVCSFNDQYFVIDGTTNPQYPYTASTWLRPDGASINIGGKSSNCEVTEH
jgi:hypothetical protein